MTRRNCSFALGSESAAREQANGQGRIRPSREPAAQPGPEQPKATEDGYDIAQEGGRPPDLWATAEQWRKRMGIGQAKIDGVGHQLPDFRAGTGRAILLAGG